MQALRGTQDILPDQADQWHYVENVIRRLCGLYGYREIRTPMFESTELFHRGIGDTTDVVTKEMYTFEDRGGRSVTLRPENTASVVRAYLEHKLYGDHQVHKFYYMGSMFRYDRPQAGRYREFHQFGVEVLDSALPAADAEVISLAYDIFSALGLHDLELHVNSIGCSKCRPVYRKKLIEYFSARQDELCDDCRERMEKNPLRILDCKEPGCRAAAAGAPLITDYLCEECREKFEALQQYLKAMDIPFTLDPRLVRGLDYYTNTAFEIQYPPLGAQSAVCGGGRYDGLVEEIGGPSIPGIGFAIGLERLILALQLQNLFPAKQESPLVYLACIGREASAMGMAVQRALRRENIVSEMDLQGRSLKGQMKQANKLQAAYTVIIGDDEVKKGTALIRTMADGTQEEVPADQAAGRIVKAITRS